jgi:hypothetical protein
MRDLKSNLDFVASFAPAARTASANGTAVDLAGFNASLILINAGTITDGTHTPKLQESDDNSTFTDVDSSDLLGSFAALTSNSIQKVGYIGNKRYLRAVVTVSGATTGGVYAATIVRGEASKYPL